MIQRASSIVLLCGALALATLVASVPFSEVTDLATMSSNQLVTRQSHTLHRRDFWRESDKMCDQTYMGRIDGNFCCGRYKCAVELCTDAIQMPSDTMNLKRAATSWLQWFIGDDCLDVINEKDDHPVMLEKPQWTQCPIDQKRGINAFRYNVTLYRVRHDGMDFNAKLPWNAKCVVGDYMYPACFVQYCQLESQGLNCDGDTTAMDCLKM